MKFSRNGKFILPIITAFFLSFVSCSAKNDDKNCTIRFSWWGKKARTEYTLQGISMFESLNPTIKVQPEYDSWSNYESSIENALETGTCADVMQINFDWLYKYSANENMFYDLNELSDYIELYNFTLDDLAYGTFNSKLYAIPIAFNTAIPVYDKKVLDENSLPIPSTWDELFSIAKVLKKKDMYVFTVSKRHLFFVTMAWFEQTYSKKMFKENGKLNISEEETGIIFDFVKRLVQENVVYSINEGFSFPALKENKIAGSVLWCNETALFMAESEKIGGKPVLGNFITTPGAKESGWYLKPATLYSIKKDCKNPREAAMLVNYLLNSQDFALLQKNEKGVPTSNKSLTALMTSRQLESMQYKALMKIRFNRDSINKMIPIMEDNNVIQSFADCAFSYAKGYKQKTETAKEFLESVSYCL
ncbi:extracellular solute-binding protein [uncultured Treponema sp.]|uniref:ABC transporter substrate-binding protein n=1 Tax=uncultured Treponema sp. TaxID=162155 RepID=UPI0025CFFFB6|nr:extracellular solute-binding protein [uncultured Treponema sp.]